MVAAPLAVSDELNFPMPVIVPAPIVAPEMSVKVARNGPAPARNTVPLPIAAMPLIVSVMLAPASCSVSCPVPLLKFNAFAWLSFVRISSSALRLLTLGPSLPIDRVRLLPLSVIVPKISSCGVFCPFSAFDAIVAGPLTVIFAVMLPCPRMEAPPLSAMPLVTVIKTALPDVESPSVSVSVPFIVSDLIVMLGVPLISGEVPVELIVTSSALVGTVLVLQLVVVNQSFEVVPVQVIAVMLRSQKISDRP